jgi:Zn-finger nucleic acid-binding protein
MPMKCPACPDVTLSMTNRDSIEIDYCPKCRGVWLDRGELDKIIERSLASTPANAPNAPSNTPAYDPRYSQSYKKYDDDDHYKHQHGKRRRGFLGDIFDFD